MKQKKNEDFLKTPITFAVVVRADIPDVRDLKKDLDEREEITLIYQKTSSGKLFIKEEEEAQK